MGRALSLHATTSMLRTIIVIDKAATFRSVETGNAPRFRRNETCAESAQTAGKDKGDATGSLTSP